MIEALSLALQQQGYEALTPVQEAVTQPELEDADLLVSAQTGSGKTVGFGLAIAPTLLGDAPAFGAAAAPLALIIAPTRELALQVRRELTWLYGKTGAIVTSCVGGMDMRDERRALARGAHIVVATPGRLRDHIQRNSMDMSALRAVVLDEADEMLDLGFREDLEFILGEAPESRRTLMFSATVPRAIANLARSYQKDAVRVTTKGEATQHTDIEYRALNVAQRDVENAIINVLRYYEAKNAIVFCNTRATVNRLTTRFTNRGFSVVALSGELTQTERTHALQAMRDGRARVCVATDVAARGIDLPNLELVIHADLPTNADTLLHRSGRTGRAGRKGVSALIVPAKARSKADRLLRTAKVTAEWANPPSAQEVLARDEERLLADSSWTDPIGEDAEGFAAKLVARFSPEQLAAAYIQLYRSRQSAPEELSAPGSIEPRAKDSFGPSTWFSVSVGRANRVEARWLLPLLCRKGDITKDDIGAIRIQQTETYVQILDKSLPGFLAALGPGMALEDGATLQQMDAEPKLDRNARKPKGKRPDHKQRQKAERPGKEPSGKPRQEATPEPAPQNPAKQSKPKSEQPAQRPPKGRRPPKSPKTERSPMKPGAKPKAAAADHGSKATTKPRPKNAGDPSKRVGPKGSGKPRGNTNGGNAFPRRGKGKAT